MSITSNNTTSALSSNGKPSRPQRSESALPQWILDCLRPIVGRCSRVLWKLEHRGVENIPKTGGLIIAANHQSYGDPFWLSVPIHRPIRYLAWSDAFAWPLVGRFIRWMGAWPLQIEGSDPAAIRRSLSWLRDDGVVVIFPEGQRGSPDGSMAHMKGGAVRMALEAGVPILPVTITGANFGPMQSTVTFNGQPASVSSWSSSSIVATVPATASTGPVVVTVNGAASLGVIYTVGPTDSDGDGLPDSWELQYFGNLLQGPNDDPDGDGATNLQELNQGRNPALGTVLDPNAVNLKLHSPVDP